MERFAAAPSSLKKKEAAAAGGDLFRPNLQHRIGARFMTRYCSEKRRTRQDDTMPKIEIDPKSPERESVCVWDRNSQCGPIFSYYDQF